MVDSLVFWAISNILVQYSLDFFILKNAEGTHLFVLWQSTLFPQLDEFRHFDVLN